MYIWVNRHMLNSGNDNKVYEINLEDKDSTFMVFVIVSDCHMRSYEKCQHIIADELNMG